MKKNLFVTLLFVVVIVSNMMAQTKPLSEQMAATVMKVWPDSFNISGGPAKWSYDQGVILKGLKPFGKTRLIRNTSITYRNAWTFLCPKTAM